MYRQGDVLFKPSTRMDPDIREELDTDIVARGEETGHAHRVQPPGKIMQAGSVLFVEVPEGETAKVTHEEHDSLALPEGIYEVANQREYEPDNRRGSRQVLD